MPRSLPVTTGRPWSFGRRDCSHEAKKASPSMWRIARGKSCRLSGAISGISQIPPDLVVKSQAVDIAEVILSRIRRPHVVHTLCRPRKSRCELLSTSEAHWFTTKSECAVKAQGRNVARPESMQVLSEPLELSSADHSAG